MIRDTPLVVIARIDELLATKKYDWARDSLEGIRGLQWRAAEKCRVVAWPEVAEW